MNAMVLCPGGKRHVFAGENACPFCGVGFSSTNHAPTPMLSAELSRAQRYVVGAAIAASVATAGCSSSPVLDPVVRDPVDAKGTTVDVQDTQSDGQQHGPLEVARDPNPDDKAAADQSVAGDDAAKREQEAARAKQLQEERAKREAEERRYDQMRRGRPACINGNNCPPYGCVFPDEACDTFSV